MPKQVEFSNEVVWKDIRDVKPNNYNPNYMPSQIFDSLKDDIQQNKFYGTIIINKKGIIIDGEHRYLALKKLGAKKVPCIVEDVNDDKAKILTVRINRERGYLTPVETGSVLAVLQKSIPLDILQKQTNIPAKELALLTALKYDPDLEVQSTTNTPVTWHKIEEYTNHLAKQIDFDVNSISTVSRGGLVPARLLADRLDVNTIYVDEAKIKGDLFVDDIYDTGKTYAKLKSKASPKTRYCFLFKRKGIIIPNGVLFAQETEGSEYVIFPWDKFEAGKNKDGNKKSLNNVGWV